MLNLRAVSEGKARNAAGVQIHPPMGREKDWEGIPDDGVAGSGHGKIVDRNAELSRATDCHDDQHGPFAGRTLNCITHISVLRCWPIGRCSWDLTGVSV